MSNSTYKSKVIRSLSKQGYLCVKLNRSSVEETDSLLVLKRGSDPYFIEFKAKGKKLDPLQEFRRNEIERKTGVKTIVMEEGCDG